MKREAFRKSRDAAGANVRLFTLPKASRWAGRWLLRRKKSIEFGGNGLMYALCLESGLSANDPIADIATVLHLRDMASPGLALTILAALMLIVTVWWSQNYSLTPEERILFTKLDAAISHEPPKAVDIINAFRLPDQCRKETCFLKAGKIGNLRYSEIGLRQPKDGIIFQIEGFTDTCVRTDRVRRYYGTGVPNQSCFDAVCWYADAQYSWGILTFQMDRPDSQCVTSAVINSLPEQRPRT